jgi:acyl carrier protein phosphodiesterase
VNYLAHLFLSGDNPKLTIGNFIADGIRKSQWSAYDAEIVKGIKLHHEIDTFTDQHPIVEQSKARMRGSQGKYTPVVMDILYDHFLSARFKDYSRVAVDVFARNIYELMQQNISILPASIQRMLPYMIEYNWLVAYGDKTGLQSVFNGMSRRARFDNNMQQAVADLYIDYDAYAAEFERFFSELQAFVKQIIVKE